MVPYALHAGLIGNVPLKVFGPKGVIFLTSYAAPAAIASRIHPFKSSVLFLTWKMSHASDCSLFIVDPEVRRYWLALNVM